MSRIGKQPIAIPKGVTVQENDGVFVVKGPKGDLRIKAVPGISATIGETEVTVMPSKKTKKSGAMWGLARALLANAVKGVVEGFEKKLQIEGIGFRGEVKGDEVSFNLGFSHPVLFPIPKGIKVVFEKNIIVITGADKERVGETAAKIRDLKKPEPYKGKGIRYIDEVIKIKAGKKAVGATG